MKCPRHECGYEWRSKKTRPLACPKCKQYINYEKKAERLVFDESKIKEMLDQGLTMAKDFNSGETFQIILRRGY